MSRYSVKAWERNGIVDEVQTFESLDEARDRARKLWRERRGAHRVTVFDDHGAVIMLHIPSGPIVINDLPCHDTEYSIHNRKK